MANDPISTRKSVMILAAFLIVAIAAVVALRFVQPLLSLSN